jgi:hypothetical protein
MVALEENMGIGADIGEWQQCQLCAVWLCETMVPERYCCRPLSIRDQEREARTINFIMAGDTWVEDNPTALYV